jgi:hypothetical protein
MNTYLKPRSIALVLSSALILSFLIGLSGCKEKSEVCFPKLNQDSIRPHVIPLALAAEMTGDFRSSIDSFNRKCPSFKDSMRLGWAESFNNDAILDLLEQYDSTGIPAAGIRIYYGRKKNGEIRLILVPYDHNGNDILNNLTAGEDKQLPGVSPAKTLSLTPGPQAIEQGQSCPTVCSSPTSPLTH